MTAIDRFDRSVADALDDLAAPTYPEYFDDALERALRTPQRPSWTFAERWLPMTSTTRRPVFVPALPISPILLILLLLAALAASVAVGMGLLEQRRPAPPFGLAANGTIAYAAEGDIYVRDTSDAEPRLIVGGPGNDVWPTFSPDGTRLTFARIAGEDEKASTIIVANADGSSQRTIFGPAGLEWGEWGPDSVSFAVISSHTDGARKLSVINTTTGAVREVAVDPSVIPQTGVTWRAPAGDELLFLGRAGALTAIYGIRTDGTDLRRITAGVADESYNPPLVVTPDGESLLLTSVSGRVDIRRVHLDTGEVTLWGEALPPPEAGYTGMTHLGSPVISPDGTRVAFGRYWDDDGTRINHQLFTATLASDGADAVPISEVHRSVGGHNPFWYAWAPDGKSVIIQFNDMDRTLVVDPSGRVLRETGWGVVTDPLTWQRLAPED